MPSSAGPASSLVWVSIFSKLPSFRLPKGAASLPTNSTGTTSLCALIRNVPEYLRRQASLASREIPVLLHFSHDPGENGPAVDDARGGGRESGTNATTQSLQLMIAAATTIVGPAVAQGRLLRGIALSVLLRFGKIMELPARSRFDPSALGLTCKGEAHGFKRPKKTKT